MTELEQKIYNNLRGVFEDAVISIIDTVGDQNHFKLTIHSPLFQNKRLIQQHKMVYTALGSQLCNDIHAMSIETKVVEV
ncbi:MAG: BolA family transcriptional regulator [Candidatus Puniceispirillum sp.]|nr:BolA family transcriptional regulator [Candidatus Pelagibacter sp.]MBA4282840.1 BolA family transcriptional regulator [Candidatus Puniceispirillum sp.]